MKLWFDAIVKEYLEYYYFFEHCYNMNESKSIIKNSQLFKALINVCEKSNWKMIQGKQK